MLLFRGMWTAVGHQIKRTFHLDNTLLCSTGSGATSNEMDSKIFNHIHEVAAFERVLKSKPQFSLVTGPREKYSPGP